QCMDRGNGMISNRVKIIILLSMVFLYIFYISFIRCGEIVKVYQNIDFRVNATKKCKSTVILVDNTPLLHNSLESMWFRNKDKIISEWQQLTNKCDDVVFVKNAIEQASDESELDFWIGENQVCLNGKMGGGQCISKDNILFFISLERSNLNDRIIDKENDKPVYIYFPSWRQ
ncbi:hypothetical protein LZ633_19420, partial [Enterobacter asburiae]|nr:hypothetical protein [Enterobacter asburiae]